MIEDIQAQKAQKKAAKLAAKAARRDERKSPSGQEEVKPIQRLKQDFRARLKAALGKESAAEAGDSLEPLVASITSDSSVISTNKAELDWKNALKRCQKICKDSGLDLPPSKKIASIGSGPGYLPYVLKLYGHEVDAIRFQDPLDAKMHEVLGLEAIEMPAIPVASPIPLSGTDYDLLVAWSPKLVNATGAGSPGPEDWVLFLKSCKKLVKPRGRILLGMPRLAILKSVWDLSDFANVEMPDGDTLVLQC